MNRVFLIGNLTKDPEVTTTTNDVVNCKFSVAVTRRYNSAGGGKDTDFFTIVCWRGLAENCGKYLRKGSKGANPVNFAFIPVNIIAGLVTGFLARRKMFSVWWKWIISMLIMAAVSIVSSAPIVVLVYGGVTGSGTSIITAAAMAAGANIWAAFFGTEGIFTVLDRIISFIICRLVIQVIPPRTLVKFGCGKNYIKEKK